MAKAPKASALMFPTANLDWLCEAATSISLQTDIREDWRAKKGELIFGEVCATCIGFLRFIPDSAYYTRSRNLEIWDLSSAASLARTLVEACYVLAYVASDPINNEERDFEQRLREYHVAFERHEVLRVSVPDSSHLPETLAKSIAAREKLQESPRFQGLHAGHQAKILKGKQFIPFSNVDLGIETWDQRELLSLPVSVLLRIRIHVPILNFATRFFQGGFRGRQARV